MSIEVYICEKTYQKYWSDRFEMYWQKNLLLERWIHVKIIAKACYIATTAIITVISAVDIVQF